jgi:predicted nucleotidyltransferase
MENVLTLEKAINAAERFAEKVHAKLDPHAEIYLFGSVIKGESHSRSDIDIAVLSKAFTNDVCNNYATVSILALDVDSSIDAQAIIYDDWIYTTPFTEEIKNHGLLVSP